MQVGVSINPQSAKAAEDLLKDLDKHVKGKAIDRVLLEAGEVLKRTLVNTLPKPGYPGDKPELKPLRDTVATKVKRYRYGAVKVLLVGYEWPAGNHGRLVEFGHEKVLWGEPIPGSPVEGKFYFRAAVRMAQQSVDRAIEEGARREAEQVKPRRSA